MRTFGEITRVGIECTGTYSAGLLRYIQQAGVTVLEVTTPDKSDRRKRSRTIRSMPRMPRTRPTLVSVRSHPKPRDGIIESLRVLKVCRKTAMTARRVALQLIHNTIVCAPDELRESLRTMTRLSPTIGVSLRRTEMP